MPWKPLPEPSKAEATALSRTFRKKARFLVDESLGIGVTLLLREAGWNVKDVREVGLSGHADEDILGYAYRDDRILLTHDAGFLDDRAFPPHRNPGLVVLPGGSGDEAALMDALRAVLHLLGDMRELYSGAKIAISADGTIAVVNREHASGAMTKTRYRVERYGAALIWEDDQ